MQGKNEGQVRLFDIRQRYRRQADEDKESRWKLCQFLKRQLAVRVYIRGRTFANRRDKVKRTYSACLVCVCRRHTMIEIRRRGLCGRKVKGKIH